MYEQKRYIFMGISAIGKDNSYLKWLQQQNGSTNSVMFRAQQNPAVDAEKMQTASVKPAEQTPAPFLGYTVPGVEATPAVKMPTFKQPLHRVASEDGSAQIGYTNSKGMVGCTEVASGYINGLGETKGLGENGQLKLRELYA